MLKILVKNLDLSMENQLNTILKHVINWRVRLCTKVKPIVHINNALLR